jgi:hypothetical protein
VSLGDSEHGLFHRLVGERLEGVDLEEFLRNVGETGGRGVLDKVLQKETMGVVNIKYCREWAHWTADSRCRTT